MAWTLPVYCECFCVRAYLKTAGLKVVSQFGTRSGDALPVELMHWVANIVQVDFGHVLGGKCCVQQQQKEILNNEFDCV